MTFEIEVGKARKMTLSHGKSEPWKCGVALTTTDRPKVNSASPLQRFRALRPIQHHSVLDRVDNLSSTWGREPTSFTLPTRSGHRPTRLETHAARTAQVERLLPAYLPHSSAFHSTTAPSRFSPSLIPSVLHRVQSSTSHTFSPGCRSTPTRTPSMERL